MLLEALAVAFGIFALRVINNAVSTVRLVILSRDRRGMAFWLGWLESMLFAITIGAVVANLSDMVNLMAYSGGYATGGYLGQLIEARFISGFVTVNIITREKGHEIAANLREQGYGVTETIGEGAEGSVTVLRSVLMRTQTDALLKIIRNASPNAFVTVEEARAVHRGWIKAARAPL